MTSTDGGPAHSVARHVAIGTAANMTGQAVVLVTRIILAAVIVHSVGVSDFGVWALIGSIASFGFLLELGISTALVKYVAEHAAAGEVEDGAKMVGAANWLYVLLAGLVCVIGIACALVIPDALGLRGDVAAVAKPVALLTTVDLAISMVAVVPTAVLKGLQRFPTVNVLTIIGALLGAALTLGALEIGWGIEGVAGAGAVNSLVVYVVSFVAVRRFAPTYLATPLLRDGARVRRLLRFSRSVAVVQVAIRLQTRLDALVVAVALPVALVTPYSFAQRLSDGTAIATDQFGKLLLPLASEVSTKAGASALRSLYLTATRLTLAISIGVGLPIILLGQEILTIWVGPNLGGYGELVALLTAAAIIDLVSYSAAAVLQSIERHGPIAWFAIGSGIANLALSIALVHPYGLEGVATATLIATTVEILGFVVPYAARVLGVPLREFVMASIVPLLLPTLVLIVFIVGGAAVVPVTSVPRLALVVGVACAAYAMTYVAVGAARSERDAYLSAASSAFRVLPH